MLLWEGKLAKLFKGTQSNCQILKLCSYGDHILALDRSSLIRLLDFDLVSSEKEILLKDKVLDIVIPLEESGSFYVLTENKQVILIYKILKFTDFVQTGFLISLDILPTVFDVFQSQFCVGDTKGQLNFYNKEGVKLFAEQVF